MRWRDAGKVYASPATGLPEGLATTWTFFEGGKTARGCHLARHSIESFREFLKRLGISIEEEPTMKFSLIRVTPDLSGNRKGSG